MIKKSNSPWDLWGKACELGFVSAFIGYINEYDIERFHRDAKIVEIYEGTKEMEKLTVARRLLGKL